MTTDQAQALSIRLLLVDDHAVVRLGLSALFGQATGIDVIGEAGTVAEAISEARRLRPDVVLMDLRLPDGSGIDACREILSTHPGACVLFLTSYPDDEAVMATILAGAKGYLLKEIGQQALIRAVEAVANGQSILDPKVTQLVLKQVRTLTDNSHQDQHDGKEALSPQECRILALVVEGKTNKEIAAALELSDKTVKNYLSNAFQKLNVSRRSQAAVLFTQQRNRIPRD